MNENDVSPRTWGRLEKADRASTPEGPTLPAVATPAAPEVPPVPPPAPPAASGDGAARVVETLLNGTVKVTYVATRNGPPAPPREPEFVMRRVTPWALRRGL